MAVDPHRRIVGIVLVRNEDRGVAQAVGNIVAFCDQVLLVDHGSSDHTPAILRGIAASHSHCKFHSVEHPTESHNLLKPYAGSNTWVFGVDGDEIYDPVRLSPFRARLLAGEFDRWWMILGSVLHCDQLDLADRTAHGWRTPPCRSITKLYNFAAIDSWDGDTPERLHGGTPRFRTGHDASLRLNLHEEFAWETAPLRCLHTCFLPRSSRDTAETPPRENIMETHRTRWPARIRRAWRQATGGGLRSEWKLSRYRRGEPVTVDVSDFVNLPA